jgi:type II secretory ATPase GspE/PulE/Tfp pilus assembly ATPase PilB-like protein
MDVESRLREAEIYRSMGLLDESIVIYEDILSISPDSETSSQENVRERIEELRREIDELDRADGEAISAKEIAFVKETLAITDDLDAIRESASSFKELGLYKEALEEYKNLLKQDVQQEEIQGDMAQCLVNMTPPNELMGRAEELFNQDDLEERARARFKFALGLEMEKKDQKNLAIDFYRSAQKHEPGNNEIKMRLESVLTSLSSTSKYDYLISRKLVTSYQLQQALAQSKKTNKSVDFLLLESFGIKKEELGKSLSLFYACPFRGYDPELDTPSELIRNLKKPFLLHALWVPLSWEKGGVEVIIDNPRDLTKTDQVRALLKTRKINFSVGIREDIEEFITRFFQEKKLGDSKAGKSMRESLDSIPDIAFDEEGSIEDEEEITEESSEVVKLVDQVLIAAYRMKASDVHIEPAPDAQCTTIRFRLDGVCQDYMKVPIAMAKGILSRVKIMARLDIAERRLSQDGKIKFRRKGIPPFELRVATIPTTGGYEDAVLRILSKAGAVSLEALDLTDRSLRIMKRLIAQPYGLILVVGPTGSGKTTTLHSALAQINKPDVKIWTAEDPVEVTQSGLRQVEVRPQIGYTFAKIMRSFLRADPDVIMVGEMRDEETTAIAIEASLTGHLVFSTLHTNSSTETVARLLDMGFNPINFSDAFLGVLAQRLVRRLCNNCRKAYHPSEEEFEEIVSEYGGDSFNATGIKYWPDLTLYHPVGCEACSSTGYKGRVAIHELLDGTKDIKRMIRQKASPEKLSEKACQQGMTRLKQDGILKVFKGLTSMSEVRRVCIQ